MERYADLFKRHVLNFKLELCCFMATVRSGVLAFACLNIAIGVMTLMFLAEESFEPLLLKALNGISSEPPNYMPSCMIVYAVELGSNVLMLCGMIRNDLILLRVYMYFTIGVLTAALMVYSVMFSAQTLTVDCLIVASIGYQIYIILLVRSAMIEIKQTSVRNEYKVNYRQSSVRYSRPGSRNKYSVVIEPYRPRGSLIPLIVKETPTKLKIIQEAKAEPVKQTTITAHSPKGEVAKEVATKEVGVKTGVVKKETTKEGATRNLVVKEGSAKEVATKEAGAKTGAVKEETTKEGATKNVVVKEGSAKEVATKEVGPKTGTVKEENTKEGATKNVGVKAGSAKETKEEVTKEVKEQETKKRKRSFFGRKEKKKDESSETNYS